MKKTNRNRLLNDGLLHIASITVLIILFSLPISLSGQMSFTKYWVQFTDKNNNPYSISNPSQFLSTKAIERRTKQNISIVENDLPVNPSYLDSIISTGAIVLNKSKWLNGVTVQVMDTAELIKINSFSFVQQIKTVARKKISRDKDLEISSIHPVNHGEFKTTDNYGYASNQVKMLNTHVLHYLGFKGEGMTIAVLDNGFNKVNTMVAFDSLRANGQILGTWNFINSTANVYDEGDHGSWVLSTMAGNLPGQLIGTAPKANYWLLHSEDNSSEQSIEEDNWVTAAEFADSVGADVINSSLGYSEFNDSMMNYTYTDMDGNTTRVTQGADIAVSKGILVCNSAGNEGSSPWKFIIAPADGDSVLAVGAVDAERKYVGFSSNGPSSDGRIKPNVCAQGLSAAVANLDNTIILINGTSFSSPITAGSSTCLWQAFNNKSNMEILNAIQQSASQFDNPDSLMGFGIPNFYKAYLNLSEIGNRYVKDKVIITQNPFHDIFTIIYNSDNPTEITVDIYDVLNRQVASTNTMVYYQQNFDFSFLSNGFYFFKITTSEKITAVKVIKM